MALSFQYRASAARERHPQRVAILPGAWNPPTVAHVALARAAMAWADEVALLLPRSFPHKSFAGAPFADRVDMLCRIAAAEPGVSVAVSEGGLYLEMADEAADFMGPDTEIGLVCGRDAAERMALWEYERPGVFEEMVARYTFLVAGRAGEYQPSPHHAPRLIALTLRPAPTDISYDDISSSEIIRRIAAGESWRKLVPDCIVSRVADLYVP